MPVLFQKWDALISKDLHPASVNLLAADEIKALVDESETERERAPQFLIENVICSASIRDKQQFVQVHQVMLIRLLDKLFAYQQTNGLKKPVLDAYRSIISHLDQTLLFIEDFFSNDFDRTQKVPAPYFFVSTAEIGRKIVLLKEKLEASGDVDASLINILIHNFDRYCGGEKASATYTELFYQRSLLAELLSEKTKASAVSVREVLFYFNFNDDEYVTYVYHKLILLTAEFASNGDKIAALRFEQKTIRQLQTKLNTVFNDGMPALKEQVVQWIEEEIRFLDAKPPAELPLKSGTGKEEKIQTALSVAKLALLLRLMVIDKVLVDRSVAQMLRIIVRTVSTPNAENIAFGSLETKYHNPDRGAISAVKDMLFRWINVLNKL